MSPQIENGNDQLANVSNPAPRELAVSHNPPPLTPTQKVKVRQAIIDYCLRMEKHQLPWHYSQNRPLTMLGRAPESGGYGDCSGYIIAAFYWAQHVTGIYVPDPSGNAYDGWGWTGSLWSTNQTRKIPAGRVYFPGDISLYGSSGTTTHHGVICVGKGPVSTARWSSFGNERAPERWSLNWLPDLLGIYRTVRLV